jgi:hypothetical protein
MPEITNDERGRRIFQIQKQRAVETVIEKLRKGLGKEFLVFSSTEVDYLKYILGESWVSMERALWERCSFSRLKRSDVEEIVRFGKQARKGELPETRAVEGVRGILVRYT